MRKREHKRVYFDLEQQVLGREGVGMFWLVFILILMRVEGGQEEPGCAASPSNNLASHESSSCLSQHTTKVCLGEVQLPNVLEAGLAERCNEEEKEEEEEEVMKRKSGCLFLLETSTRDVLTSREACALESAARNSGVL